MRVESVTIYALGGPLEGEPLSVPPAHHWPFAEDADTPFTADVVDDADGVLKQGATLESGGLFLGGGGAHVDLPNGIVSALPALTVELWVAFLDGDGVWERVFDFGTNDIGEIPDDFVGTYTGNSSRFIQLTASASDGQMKLIVNDGDLIATTISTAPLPVGVLTHVVVTYDDTTGRVRLFVDGGERGAGVTPFALSELPDVNNWIGRSNYSVDPTIVARYADFRLYGAALTPAEVYARSRVDP